MQFLIVEFEQDKTTNNFVKMQPKLFGLEWTTIHQCIIHSMIVMFELWVNLNSISLSIESILWTIGAIWKYT
jgi:hypothetical protein